MVTFVRLIRNTDFNCGDFINSIKIEWVLQFIYLICLFILYRKNSMKNILLVQECHVNWDQITSDGYGIISV